MLYVRLRGIDIEARRRWFAFCVGSVLVRRFIRRFNRLPSAMETPIR